MPKSRSLTALALLALAAVLAACGGSDDAADTASSAAAETTAAAADVCAKEGLSLETPGRLTVGTDKPAYPPYFVDDDPSNGKGFESAVAYAVAEELGFMAEEVDWVVVPFESSYAPGDKNFDFDINQISITEDRAKVVDFSTPYYTAPQAVIVKADGPLAGVTDFAGLKEAEIGVQVGTTSLDAVKNSIAPGVEPKVFNNSNDVVSAFKNGQVQAIVTDLPTALYLTAAELENAKVVGQFAAPGGDEWGLLLQKDSELTSCVDQALANLEESGKLQDITVEWMSTEAGAPTLK